MKREDDEEVVNNTNLSRKIQQQIISVQTHTHTRTLVESCLKNMRKSENEQRLLNANIVVSHTVLSSKSNGPCKMVIFSGVETFISSADVLNWMEPLSIHLILFHETLSLSLISLCILLLLFFIIVVRLWYLNVEALKNSYCESGRNDNIVIYSFRPVFLLVCSLCASIINVVYGCRQAIYFDKAAKIYTVSDENVFEYDLK